LVLEAPVFAATVWDGDRRRRDVGPDRLAEQASAVGPLRPAKKRGSRAAIRPGVDSRILRPRRE
jgi:hypothetical protein